VFFQPATQELSNASNGNYAAYSGLDLGSGVESIMLRVALASGTNIAEIRMSSVTGQLLGSCTISSTGDITKYATIGCPVDPELAKGSNKTLGKRRFNHFPTV
jgi:hypothetical protein